MTKANTDHQKGEGSNVYFKTFEIKYKPLLIHRYMTEMKSNRLVISGAGNAVCGVV